MDVGTDHAELTGGGGTACADIVLTGNIVKVQPCAILPGNNALCPQNGTAKLGIKGRQDDPQTLLGELLGGFCTPRGKGFIGVVMVMVVIVTTAAIVVVVVMVVVVTAAAFVVVVMMVVVVTAAAFMVVVMMVVIVATAAIVVVVVMVVIVATAAIMVVVVMIVATAAFMVVMIVIVVMTAAAIVVVVVMVVIVTTAAIVIVVVMVVIVTTATMVMMMVVVFFFHLRQKICNAVRTGHGISQLLTCQLLPRGGDHGTMGIDFPDQLHRLEQFILRDIRGTGEDHRRSGSDLVIIKLAKVAHITFDLGGIGNGGLKGDLHALHLFHSGDHIGQFTHAGGLDHDSVGGIVCQHLLKGFSEVTHQATADTAGIHFPNFHPGFLQKAAVNADLAKFVLDQGNFLACVIFFQEFCDQSGFSGT